MNEYNVTCYVTVAVTVRGVKAATPAHAAMSAGARLADYLGDGPVYLCGDECHPLDYFVVDGLQKKVTTAAAGSDIDGFLVETVGGEGAVRLDKKAELIDRDVAGHRT